MTALLDIGLEIERTDDNAATAARGRARAGSGRLADLVAWSAGTQRRCPPVAPRRARCVVLGPISAGLAEVAAAVDVGVTAVVAPSPSDAAFAAGAAAADTEIDSGADLLVVATPGSLSSAPALLVAVLTGAEPVALLPRGAGATDTAGWIARATELRDGRRRVAALRSRPGELLAALDDPALSAAIGVLLQAAARRTPTVLDGTAAVAAALLGYDIQARARLWWLLADTSTDPVHTRTVERLALEPVLALGSTIGDGVAGLIAVTVLRAAISGGIDDE